MGETTTLPAKKWIPVIWFPIIFPTARLKNVRVFWKKGTVGRVKGNENIIDDRLKAWKKFKFPIFLTCNLNLNLNL